MQLWAVLLLTAVVAHCDSLTFRNSAWVPLNSIPRRLLLRYFSSLKVSTLLVAHSADWLSGFFSSSFQLCRNGFELKYIKKWKSIMAGTSKYSSYKKYTQSTEVSYAKHTSESSYTRESSTEYRTSKGVSSRTREIVSVSCRPKKPDWWRSDSHLKRLSFVEFDSNLLHQHDDLAILTSTSTTISSWKPIGFCTQSSSVQFELTSSIKLWISFIFGLNIVDSA